MNVATAKKMTAKPFLKWVGGKGQLLGEIQRYYPFSDPSMTSYVEPFVGGGAVLFDVLSKHNELEVYISDTNAELVNAYQVVKANVHELIACLQKLQAEFWQLTLAERKLYYLRQREYYNSIVDSEKIVERAALLIFLNKTCFNGLYRVNRQGYFNVPMGAYKQPLICDNNNLLAASQLLQGVKIACASYKIAEKYIDEHTFAYFDPPYRPLSNSASFTAYTKEMFDDSDQKELADFVKVMSERGAKVLLSNSDPKNIDTADDFFERIYADFIIKRVPAKRLINSKASLRGEITEILVSNF